MICICKHETRRLRLACWLGLVGVCSWLGGGWASAQVVLDGKLGPSGAVAGPQFSITAGLGLVRGNNLFHSFSQFDLAAGDVATFSGPSSIHNILARVTGGSASSIDGTIRSDIPGANLFLLNPSGIVFGPNASIDVSGSFAATTADYLKLADGVRFAAALDADDSGLSTADVAAFGFLGRAAGSLRLDRTTLRSEAGGNISLVGGSVQLDGASVRTAGGEVQLAAVQSAGELPVDAGTLSRAEIMARFSGLGEVVVGGGTQIDVSGEAGGRVVIRGGQLQVDQSVIKADTLGAGQGRGINLAVAGDLSVVNAGQINSGAGGGSGSGGAIEISAGTLRLDGGGLVDENFNPVTQISTATGNASTGEGQGRGGDIRIVADRVELVNSAQVSSATYGAGDAGRIEIEADSVHLDARLTTPTQITANTLAGANGGSAGDVVIRAGNLKLENGATILAASFGSGAAGRIDLDAERVELRSGAIVTAGTFGAAAGGDIHVRAGVLTVDGRDPAGGPDLLTGLQAVTTSSEFAAAGGGIHLEVGELEMDHGASIFTTSLGLGEGGIVDVVAEEVRLAHGSTLRAEGQSYGAAGTISVTASAGVRLSGQSAINTSAPLSSGGDIQVSAGSRLIVRDSQIAASAGLDGGNISVSAPAMIYLRNSTLTAEADSTGSGFGNGGNLVIDPSFLLLNESSLISRSSLGNGGNIDIRTDYFFRSGGGIDASAPFGLPGTVTVTAPEVDLNGVLVGLPEGMVDAESLLRPDCAVRVSDTISSLTVLGRGGLPLRPGGMVPSGLGLPRGDAR